MKLILTRAQAEVVLEALSWAENPDFPDSDPINAKYIRIENKIRKALGEEEYKPLTRAEENKISKVMNDTSITQIEKLEWHKKFMEERRKNDMSKM